MEWLHEGCDSDLSADFLNFGPGNFYLKFLQNRLFFALAPRSGLGAAVSDAGAHSSIVFCHPVSGDRIAMAGSRSLVATAACVILLSFAAGRRQPYWSGCIKAAIVISQQILLHLGAGGFLFFWFLYVPFQKCFDMVFSLLWRRDPVVELQLQDVLCASCVVQSSTGTCFLQAL